MWRYLVGAVSALLMATAGFFLWSGTARRDGGLLAAPPALLASVASSQDRTVADPPEATEATREQKRFARYDRNKDGKVDRDEYLLNRRRAFARLDTDGDGKLSFDEYAVKTEAKFVTADADRSGALDATEFATTRVQRKPRKTACPPAPKPAPAEESDEG